MLERRNLHFRSKVASICKVSLHSYHPITFCHLIHDIVCGKFPRRPSNYALSLAGNLDILGDESITGCILCLLSFLPCDQPLKVPNETPHIDLPTNDFIPYPCSEEEIILTWKACNVIWSEKWYPAIQCRRLFSCGRCDYFQTVIKQEIAAGCSISGQFF
ncbi:hypothetical protein CPB86DRAFT_747736 [Serendipita vermifera]|nr:hypothetical protein CPB86DRAFT_747736 [Serendipita vermifera]